MAIRIKKKLDKLLIALLCVPLTILMCSGEKSAVLYLVVKYVLGFCILYVFFAAFYFIIFQRTKSPKATSKNN